MSQRHYPLGTGAVPLILTVNSEGPVAGLTVKARILRISDGAEWDFSDNMFKIPVSVVTPQLTLTESPTQSGVYLGTWATASIVGPTETVVIYESTSIETFIQDDPVTFQDASLVGLVTSFIEPVLDKTQRVLTVVLGLKSTTTGLIPTTAATVTVKDELGNTLFATDTVSTNGIHRAQFPNVDIVPNRVLIFDITFTFGLSTFSTTDAVKVIGVSTD